MNNLQPIISEIGVIETAIDHVKYANDFQIVGDCSKYLPFPDLEFQDRMIRIAEHIKNLSKEKILLLTPEIALLDHLAKGDSISEVLVCIPADFDEETVERIENNFPDGIHVKIIEENGFPKDFKPSNAAIVAVGYADDDRAIILRDNYKMMNVYKDFYGMKILVSCQSDESSARPLGWIAINTAEFFTHTCTEGGIYNVL